MPNRLAVIHQRLGADLFMDSRLGEYGRFLDAILAAGYRVVPVDAPRAERATEPALLPPTVVLRHDVDTDPATALELLAFERSRGIHGSWFVRWRTADERLLSALGDGHESVGYHYEELATTAKSHRARSSADALRLVALARNQFLAHVGALRRRSGLPFDLAASHGDFANRRLGLTNLPILADRGFRRAAGIRLEAYDAEAKAGVSSEFSDTAPPACWIQVSGEPTADGPLGAIARRDRVVYVLVHPRLWQAAPAVNVRDDLRRLAEEIRWRLPARAELERFLARRLGLPLDELGERMARTRAVLRAPRVRITLTGGPDIAVLHRRFTARHPRVRVTQAKRWGVALLPVPLDAEAWIHRHRALRRNERRALEAGYRTVTVPAGDHLGEMAEITRSAPIRQGRPMPADDLSATTLAARFAPDEPLTGVLDPSGRLCAFATRIAAGEVAVLSWLIGRADVLDDGVMYLLIADIVRSCAAARRSTGAPVWLMADTFWGASRGLAYFKARAGFEPFTVDWQLAESDRAAARTAPAAEPAGV